MTAKTVAYTQRLGQPDLDAPSSREAADELREAMAVEDVYFAADDQERALAMLLDHMCDKLEEDERDCLHLVLVAGMTMNQAAEYLGWRLPDKAGTQASTRPRSGAWDRKRVSRNLDRAKRKLRGWLTGTPWVDVLLEGRMTKLAGA